MSVDVENKEVNYTPAEIVAQWHTQFETELAPWTLDDASYAAVEKKLIANIEGLLKGGATFKAADLKNSLRVATDVANICKLLQPNDRKVRFDAFQFVLKLCAKHHQTCQGPGGAGGWCDV